MPFAGEGAGLMRSINSLEELNIPQNHILYLERLLKYLKTFPKVERVVLFGSCAKNSATPSSDIDLLVLGPEMTDDDEWDIAWNCPKWDDIQYVSCDILSGTYDSYEKLSKVPGMVQHAIELRGVDLSELLRAC